MDLKPNILCMLPMMNHDQIYVKSAITALHIVLLTWTQDKPKFMIAVLIVVNVLQPVTTGCFRCILSGDI